MKLYNEAVQKQIIEYFPKPEIHRRNTGYAIDELIKSDVFSNDSESKARGYISSLGDFDLGWGHRHDTAINFGPISLESGEF